MMLSSSNKVVKTHPLNGAHTAGIFADMSADGPIIGTLVLIVDRAKNLPNRKTIGKQDPYCAARLGKEAKKTTTDIRGGQTPRWDQELRFTVHDSADYYQLKVSVFHDDKRTDLIGEGWIDLKDIIVPGGNQNDLWHGLTCKGKYAGDIRIEITYYDNRPKPEKPVVKAKQPEPEATDSGSMRGKAVKRRPLPSDPVTGEAPAAPKEQPPQPQAGPRPIPKQPAFIPNQSPLQAVEYNPPPAQRQYPPEQFTPAPQQPAQAQSQPPPPPPSQPGYGATPPLQLDTPPRPPQKPVEPRYDNPQVPRGPVERYENPPPQMPMDRYENVQPQRSVDRYENISPQKPLDRYENAPSQRPVDRYENPPPQRAMEHYEDVSQQRSIERYDNPPPPQFVDRYQDPPSQRSVERHEKPSAPQRPMDPYQNSPQRPMDRFDNPPPAQRPSDRYSNPPPPTSQYDDRDFSPYIPQSQPQQFDQRQEPRMEPPMDLRPHYSGPPEPFIPPALDDPRFQLPPDDAKPPPPPVHRSRNNSGSTNEMILRNSYDTSPTKATPPMRHDVLRNEAHRSSLPAYSSRPPYRGFETSPAAPQGAIPSPADPYEPSPPRHHSYDSAADHYNRSMQPTVEDAPESPTPVGRHGLRNSSNRPPQYDDRRHEADPTPAPLNLSRGSTSSGQYSPNPPSSQQQQPPVQHQRSYESDRSPHSIQHHRSYEDRSSFSSEQRQYEASSTHASSQQYPMALQRRSSYEPNSYHSSTSPMETPEQVPSNALVPRKAYMSGQYNAYPNEFEDGPGRRSSGYALPSVPSTLIPGMDPALAQEVADRIYEERRHEERRHEERRHENRSSAHNVSTPPRGRQYSEPPDNYGQGSSPVYGDDRSVVTYSSRPPQTSNPRPVSPAPNPNHRIKRKSVSPVPPPSEDRRFSDIPFGPDSYDALNPSYVSSRSAEPDRPDYTDPDAKIITHDGREIDPSDHLPMESWAPEPEPKKESTPGRDSQRDSRQYPSPGGPQPQSASGRRQLRIAGRPQSMASPVTFSDELPRTPPAPASGSRNRLQKKSHRMSTLPPSSSPAGSSPLAPIASHNYQEGNGSGFTPTRPSRANTWDYPNENHAPEYRGSPQGTMRSGPPIPAKVPMPIMSGALVPTRQNGSQGGTTDWALMEEMSRIDIGSGRSRRHGGY